MRRVPTQPWRLEGLEARNLLSASDRIPGEGFDLQFLSDVETDTTPVISESSEAYRRIPLEGGFKWYDGTVGSELISHGGSLPFVVVDGWNVWPRDYYGQAIRTGEPSEANTRWLANDTITKSDTLVIDIENWQMDIRTASQAVVNQNIARFENIIRWIREEQPTLKVGIYSLFPASDLYASTQYNEYYEMLADPGMGAWYRNAFPGAANQFARWQNTNVYLDALASKVDIIFPALYTSSPNIVQWDRYAVSSVFDARRYGKPVVPFIMPTYHAAASSMNRAVIAPEMWAHQLNLLPEIAEGVIIWTDELAPGGADQYWVTMAIAKINGAGAASYSGGSNGFTTAHESFLKDDDEGDSSLMLINDLL